MTRIALITILMFGLLFAEVFIGVFGAFSVLFVTFLFMYAREIRKDKSILILFILVGLMIDFWKGYPYGVSFTAFSLLLTTYFLLGKIIHSDDFFSRMTRLMLSFLTAHLLVYVVVYHAEIALDTMGVFLLKMLPVVFAESLAFMLLKFIATQVSYGDSRVRVGY